MAATAQNRLIIVTVADDVRVLQGRVGSTPRGYDGLQRYETSGAARATMKALAGDYHLTQLAEWPIPLLKVHCAVFEIPKESTQEAMLQALKAEPRVRLVQPMGVFETRSETYNDPYIGLQSGFRQLDVADAHGLSRGEGVRVAVIDTGVDVAHPDLANRVVATRDFVGGTSEQFRRDRHGTEVAGVIGALANNHLGIVGVAPGVKLIALKACWQLTDDTDTARCNSFTLAKAISAAIDLKSQVVNLSLGGPSDALLAQLVESGIQRGIVFVGAASGAGPGFPQDVPGVLAVSASESDVSAQHRLHAPGSRDPHAAAQGPLRLRFRVLARGRARDGHGGVDARASPGTCAGAHLRAARSHERAAGRRRRRIPFDQCLRGARFDRTLAVGPRVFERHVRSGVTRENRASDARTSLLSERRYFSCNTCIV